MVDTHWRTLKHTRHVSDNTNTLKHTKHTQTHTYKPHTQTHTFHSSRTHSQPWWNTGAGKKLDAKKFFFRGGSLDSPLDLWDLIAFESLETTQIPVTRTVQPVVGSVTQVHERSQHIRGIRFNAGKVLTVFPQTSNFRIKKLCCMCLRTTKQ